MLIKKMRGLTEMEYETPSGNGGGLSGEGLFSFDYISPFTSVSMPSHC
jgi:hypothetical protein